MPAASDKAGRGPGAPVALTEVLNETTGPGFDPGQLARASRRQRLKAEFGGLVLALPLLAFLIAFFIVPLIGVLKEGVSDPLLPSGLPQTAEMLGEADWNNLPDDALVASFAAELVAADDRGELGALARRLNTDLSGFRSLLTKTASALQDAKKDGEGAEINLELLTGIDKRWGDPAVWSVMKNASATPSTYYLLAALDLKRDAQGAIVAQPEQLAIFLPVLWRTLVISVTVTLISAALAIPLAWFIVRLPEKRAALALFCVMLPFWTSALVRITGWIVILQKDGLVNQLLLSILPGAAPLEMLYTDLSMYLGLVHLMLPFMLVPIYTAMRQLDPRTIQAALSLGARPMTTFFHITLPQCTGGIGAGCAIVFILTLGTYTTPVLLGGAGQQMLSYFISFYTNQMLNWNMAAALSAVLLAMTLLACLAGSRFFRSEKRG